MLKARISSDTVISFGCSAFDLDEATVFTRNASINRYELLQRTAIIHTAVYWSGDSLRDILSRIGDESRFRYRDDRYIRLVDYYSEYLNEEIKKAFPNTTPFREVWG
jgi:hypothetical protein